MRRNNKSSYGFSLMELMITIAIVGILASVAVPSYQHYVIRSARSEAMTSLLDAANKQEQYFVDNRVYATDLANLGLKTSTENGFYSLAVNVVGNEFTITATPIAGPVRGDSICSTLTINEIGVKGATGSGGANTCWER
ncbi:type IV pilin protein [Pseudoalteromonas xiamenensis]